MVESAIGLARAELRLLVTRVNVVAARLLVVTLTAAVALPLLQVAVALLALSPLIGALRGAEFAVFAVGLSLPIAAISMYFVVRAARSLARELEQLTRGE